MYLILCILYIIMHYHADCLVNKAYAGGWHILSIKWKGILKGDVLETRKICNCVLEFGGGQNVMVTQLGYSISKPAAHLNFSRSAVFSIKRNSEPTIILSKDIHFCVNKKQYYSLMKKEQNVLITVICVLMHTSIHRFIHSM